MLRALYYKTLAKEFGPLALQAIRGALIGKGYCRTSINRDIGRIKLIVQMGGIARACSRERVAWIADRGRIANGPKRCEGIRAGEAGSASVHRPCVKARDADRRGRHDSRTSFRADNRSLRRTGPREGLGSRQQSGVNHCSLNRATALLRPI